MAKRKGQTMQWPNEKDRKCIGQKKRTDNAMVKRKGQKMHWPKEKDRSYANNIYICNIRFFNTCLQILKSSKRKSISIL
jgi:hypothetical protein